MSVRRLASLLSLALLLGGCVGDDPGPMPSGSLVPSLPASSDQLVIRVAQTGGFAPAALLFERTPSLSIYSDGRVISEGPQIMLYPGPLLLNLQVAQISATALADLLAKARSVGLWQTIFYDSPGIADATTTVLTINTADQHFEVSAYALAEGREGASGSGRANLAEFITLLESQTAGLSSQGYRAHELCLKVARYSLDSVPDLPVAPTSAIWPLEANDPLAAFLPNPPDLGFGPATRFTEPEVTRLLGAFAQANTLTPWSSGTPPSEYALQLRLLLPDEHACPEQLYDL
jgi:hypothetical protein